MRAGWFLVLLGAACHAVSAMSNENARSSKHAREINDRSPSPIEAHLAPLPQHFEYGPAPSINHHGQNSQQQHTHTALSMGNVPYAIPVMPAQPFVSTFTPPPASLGFPILSDGRRAPAVEAHLRYQEMMRHLDRPVSDFNEYFQRGRMVLVPPQQRQAGTHFAPRPPGEFHQLDTHTPTTQPPATISQLPQAFVQHFVPVPPSRQDHLSTAPEATGAPPMSPRHVSPSSAEPPPFSPTQSIEFLDSQPRDPALPDVEASVEQARKFIEDWKKYKPKRGRPKGAKSGRTRTALVVQSDARLRDRRCEILNRVQQQRRANSEADHKEYFDKILDEAEHAATDPYLDDRTRERLLAFKKLQGLDRRKALSRLVVMRKYRDRQRRLRTEAKLDMLRVAGFPEDEVQALAAETRGRLYPPKANTTESADERHDDRVSL